MPCLKGVFLNELKALFLKEDELTGGKKKL